MSLGSVVVTGGAGFIGSHLVEALVERSARVIVLDNFRNGGRWNLAKAGKSPRVEIVEGDVRDPQDCQRVCRGATSVYHLACMGVRHSLHDPVENHEVNALGTLRILEAAREARVRRFVYVSTSEVYGRATEFPIRETTATWPLTVYGASKLAGEHYTRAYFECFGLPAVRVRPFNNFGPRAHFEGDAGEVIPRFILRVLAGQRPVIFGDGSHTRDFLYVRDCAEALMRIAESDALVGELVNLGYGEEIRIDALARWIGAAAGREDLTPILSPARPADVPRLLVDGSRLREATGFKPTTSLQQGLAVTVEYYRQLLREDPGCLDRIVERNWAA